jgi:hypothetical protein
VNETSQQQAIAGVGLPKPNPAFSIEIEKHLFQKLGDISTRENIPLRELVSELLKYMLVQHSRELRHIVETIKKRAFR